MLLCSQTQNIAPYKLIGRKLTLSQSKSVQIPTKLMAAEEVFFSTIWTPGQVADLQQLAKPTRLWEELQTDFLSATFLKQIRKRSVTFTTIAKKVSVSQDYQVHNKEGDFLWQSVIQQGRAVCLDGWAANLKKTLVFLTCIKNQSIYKSSSSTSLNNCCESNGKITAEKLVFSLLMVVVVGCVCVKVVLLFPNEP